MSNHLAEHPPEVYIDPLAGGRLTPEALLRSTGTVELRLGRRFPDINCRVFHIGGDGFWFGMGFIDGNLVLQRREYTVEMPETLFRSVPGAEAVLASWSPTYLLLQVGELGSKGMPPHVTENIAPIPAPLSLVRWARQQSLIPTTEYDTEEDFVSRVHSGLSYLQDKIDQMPDRSAFWDLGYANGRTITRRPKRETALHGIVHALLSDQLFISSIDTIPEVVSGNGRLDFLFQAAIREQGVAKMCAEFKVAHSASIIHGIEHQLPEYMRRLGTNNGAYCVLDFAGEGFKNPTSLPADLHVELARAARRGWGVLRHPIKVHHLYVGDTKPPSKRHRPTQ